MRLEIVVCAIGGSLSEEAEEKILEAINDKALEISFTELTGIYEQVYSRFISLYEYNKLFQSSDTTVREKNE